MRNSTKIINTLLGLAICLTSTAQVKFSLSTDFSVLRSFKKEQRFWAMGQTVTGHFHFTPKEGAYVWFAYYSDGKFSNDLSATAKSILTTPQQIDYRNSAALGFKHISLGWKHYFIGTNDSEKAFNLYGYAGFGLMLGEMSNKHSVDIDTVVYQVPVLSGTANFKRLTLDLGLGAEFPVGGDIYVYGESRLFVPSSDYPSRHVFINNNAPLAASVNIGLRILFN